MSEFKFSSITQYSSEFRDITKSENQAGKNFCPFFSLITANRFLQGQDMFKDTSKQIHEGNIARSIMTHVLYDKGNQMYFDELLNMTNLDPKMIITTMVEYVVHNEIGYDEMFPEGEKGKYVVIFLKNGKYFVVLVNNGAYYLRDCHEPVQYNSFTRNEIIKYLNEAYQFDHEIDLDGYIIEEYSSIEFIQISMPFKTNFDYEISSPVIYQFESVAEIKKDEFTNDDFENDTIMAEQLSMLENEQDIHIPYSTN